MINPNDSDWERTASGRLYSYKYGYGVLDAYAFVTAAQKWELVKPQTWVIIRYHAIRRWEDAKDEYKGVCLTVLKIRLRSRQQCCLITTCKRWSISIFVFGSITQDVEMWWLSLSVPTVLKVFLCGWWGKDWVPWMEVHDSQTLVRIVYDLGGIPTSSNLDLCVMQGWKSCRERDH